MTAATGDPAGTAPTVPAIPARRPAGHTVEKIGGTSIADTDAVMANVLLGGRSGPALYNRIFVVSAYAGISDLLLDHKKSGTPGVYALFAGGQSDTGDTRAGASADAGGTPASAPPVAAEPAWSSALTAAGARMREINAGIFADADDRAVADAFVDARVADARSCLRDLHRLCSYGHFRLAAHLDTVREMLAALGEAHSARNTALLLARHGVDAAFVDLTGWRDDAVLGLDARIRAGLDGIDLSRRLPIVTGYARFEDESAAGGMMRRFGRGYTEVTFSRIAVLTGAREAIIHKEFHLSSADPKLVGTDRVRTIGETTYDVADQLSNLGMEAVHPRAAKGLRQASIPLRVKNTFQPDDAGTVIRDGAAPGGPRAEIVTGIRGVYAFEFFEQDMVGVKGYDAAILEALRRHDVRVVTKSSNANTIAHYVDAPLKSVRRVIRDLEAAYPSADVTIRRVAIVSAIGSDLALPGLTATVVGAVAAAGVEVLGVHQLMRNVDVMLVVDEDDYDRAVRALHGALVERAAPAARAAA
jgi:aspartate kinase